MFDYSARIEAFRDQKVRLSADFEATLLSHRKANRDRLIARLPVEINGVTIGEASFRPQGSFAMQTVIQTRFKEEEYDIDDGLILRRSQLIDAKGAALSADQVKEKVRDALKDKRFNRQPKIHLNCVRVFYADTDAEKHHVDFPAYRVHEDASGNEIRELAGESGWVSSDPTAVNRWFGDQVTTRNTASPGRGTQFRQVIQLLKRFCRSRPDTEWNLPNGMKLTMLVAECQGPYSERIDVAFRDLLTRLRNRLQVNKQILNLAIPGKPAITRTSTDQNVIDLEKRLGEALEKLSALDTEEGNNVDAARKAWNWVFKSDGFFSNYDAEEAEETSAKSASTFAQFAVPWRERPPWPLDLRYGVTITGRHAPASNSISGTSFDSDGDPIAKHLYLRFSASTNTPDPFTAYWQVVNTGKEAITAVARRGKIEAASSAGAGGLQSTTVKSISRNEQTLYTGSHWVECFIVRNGVCVARSGPFVVNIQ